MSSLINQLYRFGDFTLDTDQRVLLRGGKPLPLTPKVFDTLLILVESSGRLVEKEELMRRLWPDTFVAEANITFNIQQLRKFLGDNARKPHYIETVSRRGYRFIAKVEAVAEGPTSDIAQLLSAGNGNGLHSRPETPNSELIIDSPNKLIHVVDAPSKGSRLIIFFAAAGMIFIAMLALAFWKLPGVLKRRSEEGRRVESKSALPPLKLEKVTVTGQSNHAAISPDGKYVAYTRFFERKVGIWLRQLTSNNNVEIVPANENIAGLAFANGGEYLYFVKGDPSALFRISLLGGVPTKIVDNLEGNFSISADDSQIAFIRQAINGDAQREYSLMVVNSDGKAERQLYTGTHPYRLDTPLWSADARSITCSYGNSTGGTQNVAIIEVSVADGSKRELSSARFFGIQKLALLPRGRGLLLSARRNPEDSNQLWRISYPGMEITQISEGVTSYGDISLTSNGEKVAASQMTRISDIWVSPSHEPKNSKRITQATDAFGWTPSGQLVYSSTASGNRDLWIMKPDGTEQRQLTLDTAMESAPTVTSDNRYIVFLSYRTGTFQVWRMNLDGGNQVQLTNGSGKHSPSTSPDGKWVLYSSTDDWSMWKVSIDGGEPVRLTNYPAVYSSVSPDGKMIACAGRTAQNRQLSIFILPIEGGQPRKTIEFPGGFFGGRINWTRDSKAIVYAVEGVGRTAIIKRPLDDGPTEEIGAVDQDEIFDFSYSLDGQFLAVTRGGWRHDIVLISDLNQ